MEKRPASRRREPKPRPPLRGWMLLLLAGLGLTGYSGYELAIRWHDFSAWFSGLRHLSEVRKQPLWENLGIMLEDAKMAAMVTRMGFLALSAVVGILCILLCRRRGVCVLLGLASLGLGIWALLEGYGVIHAVLHGAVVVGSALNLLRPRHQTPPPHPPQGPYFAANRPSR